MEWKKEVRRAPACVSIEKLPDDPGDLSNMRPDVFQQIFAFGELRHPYTGPWTDLKWRKDLMDMVASVPVRKPYTVLAAESKLNEIIRRCSDRRQAITDSSRLCALLPHEAIDSTVATDSDTAIFEASRLSHRSAVAPVNDENKKEKRQHQRIHCLRGR